MNFEFENVIAPSEIIERSNLFKDTNLNLEFSAKFLFDSAKNYAKLLGNDFNVYLTGEYHVDILNIYTKLDGLLPSNHELNIDLREDGILFFTVYGQCKFPDYVFIFLPIKNIELMSNPMQEIFKEFVAFFSDSQGILQPDDQMDYDYLINSWIPEELFNNEIDIENKTLINSYQEGKIKEIFGSIYKLSIDSKSLLKKCKSENNELSDIDKKLIDVIIDGIPLLDSDSLASYDYAWENDALNEYEYSENVMVDFERTMGIIWDDEDIMGENLQEFINVDIGEFGVHGPNQFLFLAPNTNDLFELSDYPSRFYDWYCKFFEILESYEPNN